MKGHTARGNQRARVPAKFGALRDLLRGDPLCREIVMYLSRHAQAKDTARGIAEWWINREVRPTEEALHKLLRYGVVQSFVVGSTRVYAYAKNPLLREALVHCIESLDRLRDRDDR
jgi:hypothetical protein